MKDPLADPAAGAPPSRAAWVADRLRHDIFTGLIPPGTRLRNRDLQERYEMSATPLREALQRLASEGLVIITPQHGAEVPGIDLAEAEQLYELRLILEPQAIRRSLPRAGDERIAQIDAAFAAMCDPARQADASALHNSFHRLMRVDCDSQWMLRIVDQLAINCERYRLLDHRTSDHGTGPAKSVFDEHKRLLRACRARDADVAADIMADHLTHIRDRIRTTLSKPER
ncbi:GntR family transcriptional regulator [Actinomadura opuntiae]|uniref:GntR family transcriptional regulator n=1 Tax=Actinomadura sp. OS1-43 TaxID=604315 RepID=UPI00255AB091|nr:GntR family transcriptional regulator [Actinomadura sp. OS1-43]MDL4812672.1 GntR family transcriptional regulator [Actinomadura sp. OS1-43]